MENNKCTGLRWLYFAILCVCMFGFCSATCLVRYGSPNIAIVGRFQNHTGGAMYDQASSQISVVVSQTTAVSVSLSDHINIYHIIVDGELSGLLQANGTATTLYPIVSGLDDR